MSTFDSVITGRTTDLSLTAFITCFITVLVSACGFQLRGTVELPAGVEPIYIGGLNSSSQVVIETRNVLNAYGVELTTEVAEANYQLVILDQQTDRRTAALGEGARVAEYQLIEAVTFELRNDKGAVVMGPNTITERKIVPNDPNKVLSSGEEEQLLRREMLQRLAAKIARQLQTFNYPDTRLPEAPSPGSSPQGSSPQVKSAGDS